MKKLSVILFVVVSINSFAQTEKGKYLAGGSADMSMSLLFTGMYEAAREFDDFRLPECFGGLTRSEYGIPVKYPVACSPQAWASGAIPFMLTACLGITPDALNNQLIINRPHLPSWLDNVQFNNVKVGNTLTDLNFRRVEEETLVNVSKRSGDINVLIKY